MAKELSGPKWVLRFPTSKKIGDLESGFQSSVKRFKAALEKAGAKVKVNATYRPPQRAYLMHYSFKIADGLDPAKVESRSGVEIQWVHPTLKESVKAAQAMVADYDIDYAPVLKSRHTERKAIDMTITWNKDLAIVDGKGKTVTITTSPKNGMNPLLWAVGKSYGVVKLPKDRPHWSSDGH